ncbi:MAG TPA: DUF2520 domain-containing protein [Gemmatimonadaceae bacterium]|nr:DUF2520 domain-containing protein [Gemmatimonadaceae bacterium]
MSNARVFVLGAGRAGRSLARALGQSGAVDVVGVHGRHPVAPDERLPDEMLPSVGPLGATLGTADTVLVTVRDAQLPAALVELASAPLAPGAVVLHASGGSDPAELAPLRAAGHAAGTFHPLVAMADPAQGAERLRRGDAWIGVDGDPDAIARARVLADALGARVLEIPAGRKAAYHAAAVIASNFPVVLLAVAEQVLRQAGLDPAASRQALHALLRGAVDNVRNVPPQDALTGPVVRGDDATIVRHLEALARAPDVLEVYAALTRAALAIAALHGTDPERLQAIVAALDAVRDAGAPRAPDGVLPGSAPGATARRSRDRTPSPLAEG